MHSRREKRRHGRRGGAQTQFSLKSLPGSSTQQFPQLYLIPQQTCLPYRHGRVSCLHGVLVGMPSSLRGVSKRSRRGYFSSKPTPVCFKLLSPRLHPHPFYCIPTHDQGSLTANLSPRPISLISTSSVCLLMPPGSDSPAQRPQAGIFDPEL